MNVRDMFDNKHLAAEDLRGKDWTLTISKVVPGLLKKAGTSKTDKRPIISFAELDAKAPKGEDAKTLVCNKTNYKTIKALYGKTAADWIGKQITIYPTTCMFGKEEKECIRVRPEAPVSPIVKARPAQKPPDDDPTEPPEGHVSP